MKKAAILKLLVLMLTISLFTISCGDDEPAPVTGEALFSYVADGLIVTFTNTSTVSGTVTYAWDFGDGETSTDKDPVHTYASKGEYTVKLSVKDATGKNHDVETTFSVDRKAAVSLTDNTVADWDAVTGAGFVVPLGDNSGVIQAVKYDYDADFVYLYVKFEGTIADSTIFNLMVDTDLDTTTGFFSWVWPKMGIDMLLQGQIGIGEASQLGVFNYSGESHGWGWTELSPPADYYVMGGAYEEGGSTIWELGFARDKIDNFNHDALKFGLYLANTGWAEIGFAPDQTVEGEEPADGFTLNMN